MPWPLISFGEDDDVRFGTATLDRKSRKPGTVASCRVTRRSAVKILVVTATVLLSAFLLAPPRARAQQLDVALGFHAFTAPAASNATGNFSPQSMQGGLYPSFSADLLFFKHVGVNGEVTWRGGRDLYGGYQPFRPILWDFNGVWAPSLAPRISAELLAGIGATSIRFYQSTITCTFTSCTNYISSNHFMGHFGAGLRLYFKGNFFLRPEADVFLIRHNYEFSSGRAVELGASIGYTFGSR
jgi:hypothetical protein